MHPRYSSLCHLRSKLLQSDRQSCQLPTRNLQRKTKETDYYCVCFGDDLSTLWTNLCLIVCHTSWEGAVVERRSLILGPVKVLTGGHTQHQYKYMVQPQDAPLQHRDLWQGALCLQLHLKDNKDPV